MPLPLKNHSAQRVFLLLVGFFVVLLGVMCYLVPPGVDPDPCWGFMVMHSMEHGGHFNILISPDLTDIAKNRYEFLSWWSPAQYLFPWLFKTITGTDTGHGISLTVTLFSILGLTGFYMLFRKLGFSKWLTAVSIAFIATQLFFLMPFLYYTGGEVMIFGFLGWFLYGCFSVKKITGPVLLFVLVSGLTGFFFKSSFMWMFAAGITCMWVNVSLHGKHYLSLVSDHSKPLIFGVSQKELFRWLKNGLLLAVPFICAVVIIYITYLSKGDNPGSNSGGIHIVPETFSFPLASPVMSAFSIDELTDGLIYHPDVPAFSHQAALAILFIFAACSLAFMFLISRLSPDKKYVTAVFCFYILGSLFFSYMYLRQATISYEGRHFRIIGILCVPGFVYLCSRTKVTRLLFLLLWLVFIYKDVKYFRQEYEANQTAAKGNLGVSQQLYDQATLSEIMKIDRQHHGDAIFVLMSSDIAAEIQNNRVITLDNDTPADILAQLRYIGKAGPLYVLIPEDFSKNGLNGTILKCFPDYHHFISKPLGPHYTLYSAKD